MIATVTPSPRLSPNTARRSSVPNGRSRVSRVRAAPAKASLQAGSMRSGTGPRSAARAPAGPASPARTRQERVQPVDGQVHVVGVCRPQLADPVGEPPKRIVTGELGRDLGHEGVDRVR